VEKKKWKREEEEEEDEEKKRRVLECYLCFCDIIKDDRYDVIRNKFD
jgi:hypothetical protein